MQLPVPGKLTAFSDQLPENLSKKILDFLFLPNGGKTRSVGTQKQTAVGFAALQSGGRKLVNLHYDLYSANSGPVAGNPDANATKTIERGIWNNQRWLDFKPHPDWFEAGSDSTPYFNGGDHWYLADIANSNWQSARLKGLLEDITAVPGTVGWFCDVFDAGVWHFPSPNQPVRFNGTNPANPTVWPGGITWLNKMQSWLKLAGDTLRAKGFGIWPNIGALVTGWEAIDYSSIDGGMVEGFGTWGGGYAGEASDWVLQLSRCLNIAKPLILQSELLNLVNHRSYFFASAFMLDNIWVNPVPPGLDSAGAYWWPEQEFLDLGKPLSSMLGLVGVGQRDYEKGSVFVNFKTDPVAIQLKGSYQLATFSGGGLLTDNSIDATGKYIGGSMSLGTPVSTITLPPGSGAIMIKNQLVKPKLTLTLPDGTNYNIPLELI